VTISNITRRLLLKTTASTLLSQVLPNIAWSDQNIPYKEFDISQYNSVLLPRGHGQIRKLKGYYRSRYPSRDQSMQVMAFFNRNSGLYVQTKDPVGYISDWVILPQGKLRIYFYGPVPETISIKIKPDYREVATIYREWALNQYWARKKSSKFDDLSVIATASSNDMNTMRSHIPKFLNNFNKPAGCWITQWRKSPFDINYPDYRPKEPYNFSRFIQELHGNEIIPFPYINGLLWDVNCKSPVYDPTKVIKNIDGTIPVYSPKLNHLKVACPATHFWENIILNSRNNLRDLNGNLSRGVYYDVFAATLPRVCYAKNHNHEAGGSFVFQKAIRSILSKTKGVIMVEGNSEIYIDLVDSFLMHLYTDKQNIIPFWNEVYGTVSSSAGWIINKKVNPQQLLKEILKSSEFGVSAMGGPWMTARIQEMLMKPEYANTLSKIK